MLKNKEKALLAAKIEVPVIVAEILHGQAELCDDTHYALHELISDLQPDSALLAMALSAEHITTKYKEMSPSMRVLGIECRRIIEDYGTMWLANADQANIDTHEAMDALMHTPEDLDSMAELLEMAMATIEAKDKTAFTLCDILYIQCKAHALIAEEFMEAAYKTVEVIETDNYGGYTNNVIPFRALVNA